MMAPGCSWEFDGVIGLSETLCVFDGGNAAGHGSDLPDSERVALADHMIALWSRFREHSHAKIHATDEEVLIPLYDAFRAMDRALQSVQNMPRSAGAHGPIRRTGASTVPRGSHRRQTLPADVDRELLDRDYQETMVSHCFYSGGDAADALQVLAKAHALPVVDES